MARIIVRKSDIIKEKKNDWNYSPITSRSARLPEPFDPRIAKTSPPWTRADTSLSTAVGSVLLRQLPSITTAVEWNTLDMSRMQSDGIILRINITSGSHDYIPCSNICGSLQIERL